MQKHWCWAPRKTYSRIKFVDASNGENEAGRGGGLEEVRRDRQRERDSQIVTKRKR